MNKGGKASEEVLEEMRNEGKMIQQETSYVAGDNVYCVYNIGIKKIQGVVLGVEVAQSVILKEKTPIWAPCYIDMA